MSKNNGTPKSSNFHRVFPYFHHPFWGVGPTPIFGNSQKTSCPCGGLRFEAMVFNRKFATWLSSSVAASQHERESYRSLWVGMVGKFFFPTIPTKLTDSPHFCFKYPSHGLEVVPSFSQSDPLSGLNSFEIGESESCKGHNSGPKLCSCETLEAGFSSQAFALCLLLESWQIFGSTVWSFDNWKKMLPAPSTSTCRSCLLSLLKQLSDVWSADLSWFCHGIYILDG